MKTTVWKLRKSARVMCMTLFLVAAEAGQVWATDVYFRKPNGWGTPYVYVYDGPYWDSSNGSGSNGGSCKEGPIAMTLVDGSAGLYKHTTSKTCAYVCFTKDSQSNYGNFYNTEAVYSTFNSSHPVCVPNSGGSTETKNGTKYYTSIVWKDFGSINIYMYNGGLSWSAVYLYTYGNAYWDNSKGSGSSTGSSHLIAGPLAMTNSSGIYGYSYTGGYSEYVAFTQASQSNYDNFYNTKAAYRSDFSIATPLYIPNTTSSNSLNCDGLLQTLHCTSYYNNGSWVAHPADFTLSGDFDHPGTNNWTDHAMTRDGLNATKTVTITGGTTYNFKLRSNSNNVEKWYGQTGQGTITTNTTTFPITYDGGSNIVLNATVTGQYTFSYNVSTQQLSVTYPQAVVTGSFNSWTIEANVGSFGGGNTATYTTPSLAANTEYEFKVILDGVYYSYNGFIDASNKSRTFVSGESNSCKLETTMAGTYTITINKNTKNISVAFPSVPAMTGSLGLNVEGVMGGNGTSISPYYVYGDQTIILSPNHTSAPEANVNFKYSYYVRESLLVDYSFLATKLSTDENNSAYIFHVSNDVDHYFRLKVEAYYEYGLTGHADKGTVVASGDVYLYVLHRPEVSLTSNIPSLTDENQFTLTATPSLPSVITFITSINYEFFRGNSTNPEDKIGETQTKGSGHLSESVSQDVTPIYDNSTYWTYTVKMTCNSLLSSYSITNTVKVYRKWDIFVSDRCSWGVIKIYMWDQTNAYPVAFPGTAMPLVSGSTHWYTVTLDSRYPYFKLAKQEAIESETHIADYSVYPPGTFWELDASCQNLTERTINYPTVTLSTPVVVNTHQITLTGTITSTGTDGSNASDMLEVGFYVGGTKYTATCLNGMTFTRTITGLTAGTTYSVKAFATNIKGTGESAAQNATTRAAGTYTIKVRSGAGRTTPKIYAFTDGDACSGVKEENTTWPGTDMTIDITGTNYKWYDYEMSNDYNKFIISEGGDATKTADINAPLEATCYHYTATSNSYSVASCPYTSTQLYGNFTGDYDYTGMTGTGTMTCSVTLAAETSYNFKVLHNAEFYTNSSVHVTANNCSTGVNFAYTEGSSDYCVIETTVAGTYTFSFNTANNKVTVTYPAIPAATGLTVVKTSYSAAGYSEPFAGTGAENDPYMIFKDKGFQIQATATGNTPTDHFYYKFGSTEKQSPRTYELAAPGDLTKHSITVEAYFKYNGIEGTKQTATVWYQAIEVPTLTLSASPTDVEKGHQTTLSVAVTDGDGTESGNYYFYYVQAPGVSNWDQKVSNSRSGTTINSGILNTQGVYHFKASVLYHGREIFSDVIDVNCYKVVTVKVEVQQSSGWNTIGRSFYVKYWKHSSNEGADGRASECVFLTTAGTSNWWAFTFHETEAVDFYFYCNPSLITDWQRSTNKVNINADACYKITDAYGAGNNKTVQNHDDCADFFRVHVEQPLYDSNGDANGNTWEYNSNVVTGADSVSFYVCHNATRYEIQQYTDGWTTVTDLMGSRPAQSGGVTLYEGIKYSGNDHVYHARFNGTDALAGVVRYRGNFYVRSDLATGWNDYVNDISKMTEFGPLVYYDHYWVTFTGDGAKNIDVQMGDNINPQLTRKVVDNGALTTTIGVVERAVERKNVRYSYHSYTNWLDVAVIGGSTDDAYTFLSAFGADSDNETASTKVFKTTGANNAKGDATKESSDAYQKKFIDLSNWNYQADLYVVKPAGTSASDNVTIGIQARLGGDKAVQNIVQRTKPLEVLGSTTTGGDYIVRVIYHYPTNTILAGWLPAPTEDVDDDMTIEGNMILNRVENGSVQQIHVAEGKTLSGLEKIYMGLEMQRNNTEGEFYKVHGSAGNQHTAQTLYYWISLPYDCDVNDIIGLPGEYGDKWAILAYDGKARAKSGMFSDSQTAWKILGLQAVSREYEDGTEISNTMKAYHGYLLAVDLYDGDFQPVTIDGKTYASIFAYFPTKTSGYTLRLQTATTTYEDYICTIEKRKSRDSGWRIIGVPGYTDASPSSFTGANPIDAVSDGRKYGGNAFYYEYVYSDGIGTSGTTGSSEHNQYLYRTKDEVSYKAFHGYFVQYNGSIVWNPATDNVKSSIRRRVVKGDKEYVPATLRLTVNRNDMELDNTFITLEDEMSADYVVNEDLGKVMNSKATNLYSLIGDARMGANCLPLESQEVPLGIRTAVAGEYVFAIDSVPAGMTAILVDQETGLETDMSLDYYEVALEKGTLDSRFVIRLVPAQTDITTEVERTPNTGAGLLTATITDGKLLLSGIGEDGADIEVFDAAGRLVYDRRTYKGEVIDLPATTGVFLVRSGEQVIRLVK